MVSTQNTYIGYMLYLFEVYLQKLDLILGLRWTFKMAEYNAIEMGV